MRLGFDHIVSGFRVVLLCGILASLSPLNGFAQSSELTSHDNHALLYAHQLGFSSGGTPTVRMRISDGMDKIRFMPKADFNVMSSWPGGCTIRLKGNRVYEISVRHGKPGSYQYGVVLKRSENVTNLDELKAGCEHEAIPVEVVPVGSVFALKGHVFDSRDNLLMSQRVSSRTAAEKLLATFQEKFLLDEPEIYSELLTYPTAEITISDEDGNVQIVHQNVLWINLPNAGARFYDIEDEAGHKTHIDLNEQIIITPDKSGRLALVQSADVETILRGIVPAEMFASAPEAALMAQTIAARTTLIAQVGARHQADPFHLCNRQHCQVYKGLSGADSRTDKAIEKTKGIILFSEGRLVQSYYSAHCGGVSAGRHETWGLSEKSYLVSQVDAKGEGRHGFTNEEEFMKWWQSEPSGYCGHAPKGHKDFASTSHARWSIRQTASYIEKNLKKAGILVGKLEKIEILERGESYRVTKIRVSGKEGSREIEHELEIRKALGGLKSALFVMVPETSGDQLSAVTFYGAGFGHGVGMCQTGAIGMAQGGLNYEAILKHYFPGATIEKIW